MSRYELSSPEMASSHHEGLDAHHSAGETSELDPGCDAAKARGGCFADSDPSRPDSSWLGSFYSRAAVTATQQRGSSELLPQGESNP